MGRNRGFRFDIVSMPLADSTGMPKSLRSFASGLALSVVVSAKADVSLDRRARGQPCLALVAAQHVVSRSPMRVWKTRVLHRLPPSFLALPTRHFCYPCIAAGNTGGAPTCVLSAHPERFGVDRANLNMTTRAVPPSTTSTTPSTKRLSAQVYLRSGGVAVCSVSSKQRRRHRHTHCKRPHSPRHRAPHCRQTPAPHASVLPQRCASRRGSCCL
ncbi:hypothetical protein PLICRDRAFT_625228 [Plicaturopsis crispa FD-325 SS-3]|nr:hypothetical protein PLICRDRAFT_625228 [Plicaturopsis crispa FD-325 SS-3]